MSKVTRIKGDLDDVDTLLEIISVIKDVATSRFFAFSAKKKNLQRFFDAFLQFLETVKNIEIDCPLLRNNHPGVDIVVLASDQSFMSQMNSKVAEIARQQYIKYPGSNIICLGRRCAATLKMMGVERIEKVLTLGEFPNRFDLSHYLRNYLTERILKGISGKAILVHLWAKAFLVIKPRILTLLPAGELIRTKGGDITHADETDGLEEVKEKFEVILETSGDSIMKTIAGIWIYCRLYEIVDDIPLTEAAVQAQQLESALEFLGTERRSLLIAFRKGSREELNKAVREVFTAASFASSRKGK
jgi:F0F1-type ATP synthase gamma subunit